MAEGAGNSTYLQKVGLELEDEKLLGLALLFVRFSAKKPGAEKTAESAQKNE